MTTKKKYLKIQLIRSTIGRLPTHKACVVGLGFKKLNQIVLVEDTPENRGMVNKVSYMLKVLEQN